MNYEIISIIVIAVFIVSVIWISIKGYKDKLFEIIIELVMEAERELGSGTGKIKFEMVLSWIYEKLPGIVAFVIGKSKLKDWIEEAVLYIKTTEVSEGVTIEEYLSDIINEE